MPINKPDMTDNKNFYGKEALGEVTIQLEHIPSYRWLVHSKSDTHLTVIQMDALNDKRPVKLRFYSNKRLGNYNEGQIVKGVEFFGMINNLLSKNQVAISEIDPAIDYAEFVIEN